MHFHIQSPLKSLNLSSLFPYFHTTIQSYNFVLKYHLFHFNINANKILYYIILSINTQFNLLYLVINTLFISYLSPMYQHGHILYIWKSFALNKYHSPLIKLVSISLTIFNNVLHIFVPLSWNLVWKSPSLFLFLFHDSSMLSSLIVWVNLLIKVNLSFFF